MPFLFKNRDIFVVENQHYLLCLILLALMLFSPVLSHKVEAKNSAGKIFNEGLKALTEKDFSSAESSFLSVLQIAPKHAGAFYHLGVLSLSKNQLDQALKYLKQATRIDPDFLPAFLRMAEAYEQQGKLKEAIKALNTASRLVKNKDDEIAENISQGITRLKNQEQIRQSIRLLRGGKHLEAKVILQDVLLIETDIAEAHHFLAVSLGIEGKFKESIKHFKTALRLKPNLSEARSRLIELYLATGQLEHAREAVESALFFLDDQEGLSAQTFEVQLDSLEDRIVSHRLMDKALQQIKDKKSGDAATTFKALIQTNPDHALAYFNLGILSAQEKKFDQAIPFFEKAIAVNPEYREAHERLAQVYELTRFYSRARKHYEEALTSLDDQSAPEGKALKTMITRVNEAQVQSGLAADEAMQSGNAALIEFKLDLAIQYYKQASFFNREDAEIRYQLGLLYERKKRPGLATQAMQAAIELSPGHLAAQSYLAKRDETSGFFYQSLKRWKEIQGGAENKVRLEGLIKVIEEQTTPLMTRAMQVAEEGDPLSAIEILKEARTLAPDDPRIRSALAGYYQRANLPIKAFNELSAARLFEPEQAKHDWGIAKLYENAGQWSDAAIHFNKALEAKISSETLKKKAEQGLNLAIKKQKDIKAANRYLKRARRHHEKQDYRTAIRWYEKVFRLFPGHTASLYWAATAYESLFDYKSALSLYQAILEVDDKNTLAHQRLGFISEVDGEIEAAIIHYQTNLTLSKGRNNRETDWVKGRLKPLEKRLNVSLNQTLLSYDSNPTRSSNPQPDLRSSAGIGLSYLLKKNRRLQIPVGFSSDTLFFFESNILFSQQSLSIAAKGARRPFSYSAGYNFQFGLAEGGPTGFDHITALNLAWFSKKDYSAALDLSFDSFISPSSKRFNAKRSMLRLSARKDTDKYRSTLWYRFFDNDANLNDQASGSHDLGFSYTWPLSEKLRASLSYEVNSTRFSNIDSFGKKRRENLTQTASLGLSYRLEETVILNASFVERHNDSNLLAGGATIEEQLAGQAVTQEQQISGQAASLGDYSQGLISASISWSF